jgi:predicted HicB family RNase H-like nuclease
MTQNADPPMTAEQEHSFYSRAENQEPQGPARRRKAELSEIVPVRLAPDALREVRERAGADDRSVSSWIRRAIEHELQHSG